jgi:hypothetical protein
MDKSAVHHVLADCIMMASMFLYRNKSYINSQDILDVSFQIAYIFSFYDLIHISALVVCH